MTFGGEARKALDFFAINRQEVPKLYADGITPMGAALDLALNLLEARKTEYSNVGVDYYQPWMVIMTDGAPTDSIDSAANKINELVRTKKPTVFPIANCRLGTTCWSPTSLAC